MKTGDLNQKPRQGMNTMQTNRVQWPQIHKVIQGINFTPTFTSKTCKIICHHCLIVTAIEMSC